MKKIVFVKYGSFSLVNERVESMLRNVFPECDLIILDAARDILASYPIRSLWLRLVSVLLRPVAFVRGRHSPWDFVFRDVRSWKLISRWMREHVRPEETKMIVQTQSMFDASCPGVPFFVYTDHTHLAHRRHPHGGAPAPASEEWISAERNLYQRADTVFTLSKFCALSVVEDYGVPAEKVLPVFTGSNMELPRLNYPLFPRLPIVLFVAADWVIKGGPQLVRAFAKVRELIPAAGLWLVGSGPEDPEEGVRCFGRVDRQKLEGLFGEVALVCVPSLVERASMVALDAAAFGLPVITTPSGAGAERVRDGETGLIVDPEDRDALASAICRILNNPELAERMGRAGRRMVEEEFTWEAVGRKIQTRMQEVILAEPSSPK